MDHEGGSGMAREVLTRGTQVVIDGSPVVLKGVNLGSWMNIEDFMIGLSGTDWQIRHAFKRQFGPDAARQFFDTYERSFISKDDIDAMARMGFNVVRVPFNYRYFESDSRPFEYDGPGFTTLDKLFDWCDQAGVFVLLDFHAAPGGQNTTPPSDSTTGYPQLWLMRHFQDRVVALWEEMARRYRGRSSLMGYNLLNEPITAHDGEQTQAEQAVSMNALNRRMVEAIQRIDQSHVIVIEGDVRSSGGFATLEPALFTDYANVMLTYHHYPLASWEYSVNREDERPDFADPDSLAAFIERQIRHELEFAARVGKPLLLGEFSHGRNDSSGKARAVMTAQLTTAAKYGHSWTLWSYKDIGRAGLLAPRSDTPWSQFVHDPVRTAAIQGCHSSRAKHFDEVYIKTLGKSDRNRPVYDAAWNEEIRGLRRMVLEFEMRKLSEHSLNEILAMPRAFHYGNCVRAEESYEAMKKFL